MKAKHIFIVSCLLGGLAISSRAQGITISEFNVEASARPGETINRTVELYDDSLQGVTVYPTVYNFAQDPNREGSPIVLIDPNQWKPDRAWVKFDVAKVDLPKDGSLVKFEYRIEVPKDADPGTHLISLAFQTAPPSFQPDTTEVAISSNVVSDIFLKVLGTTIDTLDANLYVGQYVNRDKALAPTTPPEDRLKYFTKKSFFFKPPVDFLVTIENTGNTHQRPGGSIKIYNDLTGSSQVDQLKVNDTNNIVLPGSKRTFGVNSFGEGFMIGKYRAKLTLIYGEPLRELDKVVTFWIIPVVELAIALGALILLIILIVVIRHFQKRRRQSDDQRREQKIRQEMQKEVEQEMKRQMPSTPPAPPMMPTPPVVPPPPPIPPVISSPEPMAPPPPPAPMATPSIPMPPVSPPAPPPPPEPTIPPPPAPPTL